MGEYLIVGMAYLGWIGLTARFVSDAKHLATMVAALAVLCAFTIKLI